MPLLVLYTYLEQAKFDIDFDNYKLQMQAKAFSVK